MKQKISSVTLTILRDSDELVQLIVKTWPQTYKTACLAAESMIIDSTLSVQGLFEVIDELVKRRGAENLPELDELAPFIVKLANMGFSSFTTAHLLPIKQQLHP